MESCTPEDCDGCPNKVHVIQKDGTRERICRAGEEFIERLRFTIDPKSPVFAIKFPAPFLPDEPRRA